LEAVKRKEKFETELVDITTLKQHPENYREHPQAQLDHIVASLKAHGFVKNVVIAKDGTILAGHGVVLAARQMRLSEVPVVRLPVSPDSAVARKVLVGDNEMSKLGDIDDRALTELLKSIRDDEAGLEGTGFDDRMLAALVMTSRAAGEIKGIDEAAEWAGMPRFEQTPTFFGVSILCESEKARDELLKKIGAKKMKSYKSGVVSLHWPLRDSVHDDPASLRYE
jgi:hypothetical protein